ncbi:MAG: dockerin type I repeat-containing protein, partial [Armatimonadota bacterium]
WIPIGFSSDAGALVGSAVLGLAVAAPAGKVLPEVEIVGVVLDPALTGGTAYIMHLSRSSAIISVRAPSPAAGTLAHARLRIPEATPEGESYQLVLDRPRVYTPSGQELPVSVQNGVLQIALRLADLNSDGRVDIMDVGLCLRYALGLLTPPSQTIFARADIEPKRGPGQYGDGVLNISDVLRMLRVVLGFDIGY